MTWRYFNFAEFACHHCGKNQINTVFVGELDELRERVGFPLIVSSGYRCPDYNAMVAETGPSGPHTTGRAVDFLIARTQAYTVLKFALLLGFTGIGIQQRGEGRFIHLDNLPNGPGQPRPTVWSY